TGHSYHPEARKEIDRRIDAIAARGRDAVPQQVKFQTFTLRYNRSFWVAIEGMERHWEKARVEAEIVGRSGVQVVTSGVTELWLTCAPGPAPFDVSKPVKVTIDGTFVEAPPPRSDRSWNVKLSRSASGWKVLESFDTGLHKRHGLQGPIDDAF